MAFWKGCRDRKFRCIRTASEYFVDHPTGLGINRIPLGMWGDTLYYDHRDSIRAAAFQAFNAGVDPIRS